MTKRFSYRAVVARLLLAAVASSASMGGRAATRDFIETYLDANHGCGRGEALAFVLAGAGRQAPFGKPAAAWTDEDLEALGKAMTGCVDLVSRVRPSDVDEISSDAKRILVEVPQIVAVARQQKAAVDRQLAARKLKAEQRIQNAARAAAEPTRETADEEAARLEREAAKAEQEASIARQRKQLEDLKENQRVSRQKAEVQRQQETAMKREKDKMAALETERQHRAFLTSHNLTEASVLDLQSRGRDLENKAVAVTGYIKIFNEDNVIIYSGPNELSGVPLDLSTASAETRRRIFASCSNLYRDCRMEIAGVVGFANHVFLWVQ